MQIEYFGRDKTGVEYQKITLTNDSGVSASFSDLGGTWLTMMVPNKAGVFNNVVLGYDTLEEYLVNEPHLGAIIGRNSNRIAYGKYDLEGESYQVEQNIYPHSLHSGNAYWRLRKWDFITGREASGEYVEFSLFSKDMDQGYPGNASVKVRYTLMEDNTLLIGYTMESDKTTLCNLTNHAYFNLSDGKENILSHEICIHADSYLKADKYLIPNGEVLSVDNTPMDFRTFKVIGKDIDADFEDIRLAGGYDHNYILGREGENPYALANVRKVIIAKENESGRRMEVYTDMPIVQFYTGNFLNEEKFKRNAGFCLETQFAGNGINIDFDPKPILKVGEKFVSHTAYKFLVE